MVGFGMNNAISTEDLAFSDVLYLDMVEFEQTIFWGRTQGGENNAIVN